MDTSEQYIKMCKEAEEIQTIYWDEDYFESLSDFYADNFADPMDFYADREKMMREGKWRVWLPRQDQLQEMVANPEHKDSSWKVSDLYYKMHHFYNVKYSDYPSSFASMEQLWLAFVMEARWNKHWNGEDWA